MQPPRRFFTISPDLVVAAPYDTLKAAEAAAVAFGEGAAVVDTVPEPYRPALLVVEDGELRYLGHGQFNHRLGSDANLIEAIRRKLPAAVRAWLARGAAPDARLDGTPALIWAVAAGEVEIVRLLLDHGADAAAADDDGTTAVGLARAIGRTDLLALLFRSALG